MSYFHLFDRYTLEFRLFKLVATRYEEIQLTDRRHWFDELNLGLGVYPSVYNGVEGMWLRWTDKTGQLVLNDSESLFQERNRADRLAPRPWDRSRIRPRTVHAPKVRKGLGSDPYSHLN